MSKSGAQFVNFITEPSQKDDDDDDNDDDDSSENDIDDQGMAFVPQPANEPQPLDDLESLHSHSVMYTFADMFGSHLKYYSINFLFLSLGVCYTNYCFDTVMELIYNSWSPVYKSVFTFRYRPFIFT